jgi:hypothetical protein
MIFYKKISSDIHAAPFPGLATMVPALGELGSVLGLAIIVWFLWVGTIMLRD